MALQQTEKNLQEHANLPAEGQEEQHASEIKHEHTLYAESVAHFGKLTITNSMISSWLALVIVCVFAVVVNKKIKTVPGRIQSVLEMFLEGLLSVFDGVTGSRAKTAKIAPFVLAFFFFILLNNWLGLLPGVGSIGQVVSEHGEKVFVPYLRGATADYNTTLALAIIGVVASHIAGVAALGIWQHLNKFINIKALLEIPAKIRQDWTVILINPIKIFIGLVEIISELAKIISLSLRLYGNIFAGEVLMASISAILAFGLPLPFMFLEIMVGIIQAFIFSILITVYLTMNTAHEEH